MNDWLVLVIAGLFEVSWAISLKFAHGFSRFIPSVLTILGMAASFFFLSTALKRLPLSVAYAVWTGIGIAGTSALGMVIFDETFSFSKVLCIGLIIAGIIGLRLGD